MLRPYVGNCHTTADPCRVRRGAAQPHRHTRRGGVIAQHGGRTAETIDHDVEIAVAVEIGERHAVRDVVAEIEPPALAHILEREIAAIADRHVRQLERGVVEEHPVPVVAPDWRPKISTQQVAQTVLRVAIHDIGHVAGTDENVFPPVEIDVEKHGRPRPPRPAHAGVARDFGEGAVAAVQLQRVALHLGPVVPNAGLLRNGRVRRDLRLQPARVLAQHVDFEQVGIAVPIQVAYRDRHPGVAGRAQCVPGNQAKAPVAVVDPALIGILEVVGDVEIGPTVAVEIREHRRQAEILPLLAQRPPRLVGEAGIVRQRLAGEMPFAVIAIEEIGIGALHETVPAQIGAIDDLVVPPILLAHFIPVGPELARDPVEPALRGGDAVDRRVGLVVRDVQIEIAVAIDVGHGDRHAAGRVRQALFGEMALPVVQKNRVAAAERDEHEVLIAIAVDVSKGAARRIAARRRDAGTCSDVFEPPVAEIAIQRARAFRAGQEDVRAAIAIHVRETYAGALRQLAITDEERIADGVGEGDPGPRRTKQRESRSQPGARNVECAPTVARLIVPDVGLGRGSGTTGDDERKQAKPLQLSTSPHTSAAVRSAAPRPSATICFAALPALLRAAGS